MKTSSSPFARASSIDIADGVEGRFMQAQTEPVLRVVIPYARGKTAKMEPEGPGG